MNVARQARFRAAYAARRSSGHCVRCNEAHETPRTLCPECAERHAAYLRKRYRLMRNALAQQLAKFIRRAALRASGD